MSFPIWPSKITGAGTFPRKSPPYPYALSNVTGEPDLREEMRIILEGNDTWPRRGHWVILRRMDKRQRCTCWKQGPKEGEPSTNDQGKYNEPSLRCPSCGGEGWIYVDELHLTRRRLVSPEIGLAAQEQLSDIGWFNVNYICFYFMYYVNPVKGDKVIEVELDDLGEPKKPFVHKEIYRVAVAEPYREEIGRIEYWRCSAKLEVV
jgi:hypothetical protein